jgi:hypothetical protein
MGEWERKAQAKAYEQRTDLAADAGGDSSGTGEQTIIVRCIKTLPDAVISYGSVVRLVDRNRPRIEVFMAGCGVGEVCDDDTMLLRSKFGIAARAGSSLGGHCSSVEDSPEFSVTVSL